MASVVLIGGRSKAPLPVQNTSKRIEKTRMISASFVQPLAPAHQIVKTEEPIASDSSLHSPLLKDTYKYCFQDKYAAIVVNITTGEVVYGYNENAPRHPASLAKMMTLFLTLWEIKNQRLNMDDRLFIDKIDRRKNLSKLNIYLTDKVTVKDAMKGIITRSAANGADLLAQKISGNIPDFVDCMNHCADSLGMKDTWFTNASGAPDEDKDKDRVQVTTAHDMALLLWSLRTTFPEYQKLLGTKEFFFHENIPNHALLPGAVIGKTGWVNASGFSIFDVFPKKDGNEYIVGTFGGRSAKQRNHYVEELVREIIPGKGVNTKSMFVSNAGKHLFLPEKMNTNRHDLFEPNTVLASTDKIHAGTNGNPRSNGPKAVMR